MNYYLNLFIQETGIALSDVILVLMLPIIATIMATSRHILGIRIFGLYTPSIITLSFLALGLKQGLLVFIFIIILASLLRFALKKLRLLYLPKLAIILSVVALSFLVLFIFQAIFWQNNQALFSFFPVVILVMLAEKFITIQIKKDPLLALKLTLESLLVPLFCYFLVAWPTFQKIILSWPWLVLLVIPINILVGRYSGLRLTEYFRFRQLKK